MISYPPVGADIRPSGAPAGLAAIEEASRIVIVDDDPGIRELLTEFLVDNGLGAEAVASGAALRDRLRQRGCDLIILDLMMPGEDGLSVLRSLMQTEDRPGIIMLSAVASEVDRIVALEMGADDYVIKPASPREILARIRSVLRRRALQGSGVDDSIEDEADVLPFNNRYSFAGWLLDCRMRTLTAPDGSAVLITDGEFNLLMTFVTDPQTVHTREQLAALAGKPKPDANDRTIDVSVSRLRRKLAGPNNEELVRTVRGQGYLFLPEVRSERR